MIKSSHFIFLYCHGSNKYFFKSQSMIVLKNFVKSVRLERFAVLTLINGIISDKLQHYTECSETIGTRCNMFQLLEIRKQYKLENCSEKSRK